MEFKHIQYFLKLSDCSSFTVAAHELYISQQALSKCIQNLEKELNVRLFDRSSSGIMLTDDGAYLRKKFRHICAGYDEAVNETLQHFSLQTGKLEFGVCPGFFRSLPVSYLIGFQKKFPGISIEQLEKYDKDCEDYVRIDPHNFALSTKPWHQNGLHYIPLHRERLFMIANKNHPFANRESVSLKQLEDDSFVFFNNRYNIHYRLLDECRRNGFTPDIVYMSADVSQLVKLASQGMGILICVEHIYQESNHENLVCIPLSDPEMYWELGMIAQDFVKLDNKAKTFMNYIYEVYRSELRSRTQQTDAAG